MRQPSTMQAKRGKPVKGTPRVKRSNGSRPVVPGSAKERSADRSRRPNSVRSPTFIDIFCGAGALRTAFEQCDARCVWSHPSDQDSFEGYRENFGDGGVPTDGREIPPHDILVADLGTCPATPKRNGSGTRPVDEILDVLGLTRPPAFLLTNPARLAVGSKDTEASPLVRDLTTLGYHVHSATLDARRFGSPAT